LVLTRRRPEDEPYPACCTFDEEELSMRERSKSFRFARKLWGVLCAGAVLLIPSVPPGPHTVEVLFAGCCSAAPPVGVIAYAGSPVLVVQYR
jgi:hypothetical protein